MKLRSQKGQAALEVAFAILLFLGAMTVMTDMVRICHRWVSLQYAVNEGGRYGSLGPRNGKTDIEAKIHEVASQIGIQGVSVHFKDESGSMTAGDPLTFLHLSAQAPVVLTPISALLMQFTGDYSGTYSVTAETLTRNEPAAG